MDQKLKRVARDMESVEAASFGATDGNQELLPRVDSTNVTVSYGIHHGRYPIGGMTVRDARRTLQHLIHIDPGAVAVINGAPVDEDQRISADVSMLSFVKPSAMKG